MWLKDCIDFFFVFTERKGVPYPKTLVETGCYRGEGLKHYLSEKLFDTIHSIELSQKWFDYCSDLFKNEPTVHLHQGDSAKVLYELSLPPEPVCFYFDAHYSGGPTAGETLYNGCPILEELKFIASRNVKGDIVIVDDIRLMGKKCISGTQNSEVYPVTLFDFRHASLNNMFKIFSDANIEVDAHMVPNCDRMIIYIV